MGLQPGSFKVSKMIKRGREGELRKGMEGGRVEGEERGRESSGKDYKKDFIML